MGELSYTLSHSFYSVPFELLCQETIPSRKKITTLAGVINPDHQEKVVTW